MSANQDDVTVFFTKSDFLECFDRRSRTEVERRYSLDFSCSIEYKPTSITQLPRSTGSRVHAAKAFGGAFYSVTIRGPLKGISDGLRSACLAGKPNFRAPLGGPNFWIPERQKKYFGLDLSLKDPAENDEWIEAQKRIAAAAYKGIFGEGENKPTGLVLITGGTGTGKSSLLNLLLSTYLSGLVRRRPDRRPHVVAVGDPVETLFFEIDQGGNAREDLRSICAFQNSRPDRLFDFTARVLGLDTPSVSAALTDALRETPSAYVVGELRDEEDFFAALDFAATGHLIFATAHNTSLVDALGKLVRLTGADTPSGRATLAQRLKAVIHLRPIEITSPDGQQKKVTLPSIWRGNSAGVRTFVADGLASLLPHGKSKWKNSPEEDGVLGLSWVAEELLELSQRAPIGPLTLKQYLLSQLLKKCYELDLEVR